MSSSKQTVLILGGSKFVGINLIARLLRDGCDVTLLNRGHRPVAGTRQLIADRNRPEELESVARMMTTFDSVIDTSSFNRAHTVAAWEAFSRKAGHWIHLSSAAVYQEKVSSCPSEHDSIGGASIWGDYAAGKSAADQFLIEEARDVPVTIFRPPYLYGPYNHVDRETFVWARALQRRPVIVPAQGSSRIQFLHIADLVEAMRMVMTKALPGTTVYNVAASEMPTLAQWVAIASEAAGLPDPSILASVELPQTTWRQYFPFRDSPLCVATERIEALGWRAHYDLLSGLRQTYSTHDVELLKSKTLDTAVEDDILAAIRAVGTQT